MKEDPHAAVSSGPKGKGNPRTAPVLLHLTAMGSGCMGCWVSSNGRVESLLLPSSSWFPHWPGCSSHGEQLCEVPGREENGSVNPPLPTPAFRLRGDTWGAGREHKHLEGRGEGTSPVAPVASFASLPLQISTSAHAYIYVSYSQPPTQTTPQQSCLM